MTAIIVNPTAEPCVVSNCRIVEHGPGRPPKGYRAADGKRIPGTTTITGRFKDPGGLYWWYWNQGAEGFGFNEKRDEAAGIGDVVHDAVRARIRGQDGHGLILSSALEGNDLVAAEHSFGAYVEWEAACRVTYHATEVPLVSEVHRFGGTPDAVGAVGNDALTILDWKSAKAIYQDNLLQVAAYALLWEECRGQRIDVAHICRFSKTSGAFEHRRWCALEEAKVQFRTYLDCYRRDKRLAEAL